jgi:hypothetical protein
MLRETLREYWRWRKSKTKQVPSRPAMHSTWTRCRRTVEVPATGARPAITRVQSPRIYRFPPIRRDVPPRLYFNAYAQSARVPAPFTCASPCSR